MIIKNTKGNVIYEDDASTMKASVVAAVKKKISLREANLSGADLSGADLSGADLFVADLSGANLSGANLSGANLLKASLQEANRREANLREANIAKAKTDEPICRMDFGGWSICIRKYHTIIGCQDHFNDYWLNAGPLDVAYMDEDAAEWWRCHGPAVKAAIAVVEG